jgi:Holliday junction DNA helicase RuvA
MIGYLSGKILYTTKASIVIKTGSIGYEVRVSPQTMHNIEISQETEMYIYHHVTENSQVLFGFRNLDQRGMFLDLISVSGIGPKIGLGIVDCPWATLRHALINEDIKTLTDLPGIGKKTAQRLILELGPKWAQISSIPKESRNTLGKDSSDDDQANESLSQRATPLGNTEALEGLVGLGYTRLEATRMIAQVPIDMTDTSAIIHFALKATQQ